MTITDVLEAARLAGVELDVDVPKPLEEGQSVLTHNGIFTVRSNRTGEHRTFRVRTKEDTKRELSLLTGPDNTHNYTPFAYITDRIEAWKYADLVDMLSDLPKHIADGKVTVFASVRCRICNRPLTTPESVTSGIGPICEGR